MKKTICRKNAILEAGWNFLRDIPEGREVRLMCLTPTGDNAEVRRWIVVNPNS
jgi:hypothetical protein